VKVDELLNILHCQHDITSKCTCMFPTFKYYSIINQNFNEFFFKNSIWPIIFKHVIYFYCTVFFKFYNHLTINSKKSTMFLIIMLYWTISIYFLLLVSKIKTNFYCLFLTTFYIYFTMSKNWKKIKITKWTKHLSNFQNNVKIKCFTTSTTTWYKCSNAMIKWMAYTYR
jgi:hypothetical protein